MCTIWQIDDGYNQESRGGKLRTSDTDRTLIWLIALEYILSRGQHCHRDSSCVARPRTPGVSRSKATYMPEVLCSIARLHPYSQRSRLLPSKTGLGHSFLELEDSNIRQGESWLYHGAEAKVADEQVKLPGGYLSMAAAHRKSDSITCGACELIVRRKCRRSCGVKSFSILWHARFLARGDDPNIISPETSVEIIEDAGLDTQVSLTQANASTASQPKPGRTP